MFRTAFPITSSFWPRVSNVALFPIQQDLPTALIVNGGMNNVSISCNINSSLFPNQWIVSKTVIGDCQDFRDYEEVFSRPEQAFFGGMLTLCGSINTSADREMLELFAPNTSQLTFCGDPVMKNRNGGMPYNVELRVKSPVWTNANTTRYRISMLNSDVFPVQIQDFFPLTQGNCREITILEMQSDWLTIPEIIQ